VVNIIGCSGELTTDQCRVTTREQPDGDDVDFVQNKRTPIIRPINTETFARQSINGEDNSLFRCNIIPHGPCLPNWG
jgi:hypothetical protein